MGKLLNGKTRSFAFVAVQLAVVTVAAKVIGFLREATIGYFFGATITSDIYYLANSFVANVLFSLTSAASVVLIPMYIKKKHQGGEKAFLGSICIVLTVVSLLMVFVLEALSPWLSHLLAPSADDGYLQILTVFIRVLMLGFPLSLIANIFVSILNAESRFGFAAVTGLIYSTFGITFVILFHDSMGLFAMVISTVLAYFVQCLVLIPKTKQYIGFPGKLSEGRKDVRKILLLSLPVLLSNGFVALCGLVGRVLASTLAVGSVSALAYSKTIFDLVYQVVCNSVITVLFTKISLAAVDGDDQKVGSYVSKGISLLVLVALPLAVWTMLCSTEIVTVAFQRGAFNAEATEITSLATALFAPSFLLSGVYMLLNKVFYANEAYYLSTAIYVIAMICNLAGAIAGVSYLGLAGIILAGLLSDTILCVLLLAIALRKGYLGVFRIDGKNLVQVAVSSAVSALILLFVKTYLHLDMPTILILLLYVVVFGGFYLLFLVLFGNSQSRTVLSEVIKRIGKLKSRMKKQRLG